MHKYRIRYEEPESGGTFASLMIGAVAGFAVGMLVAQKSGGIAGIAARVKDRWAELEEAEADEDELPEREAAHEREFDEALLADLPAGADPCGERGEFHTFAYAGPMFRHPVPIRSGEIVTREGFVFADLVPSL